MCLVCEKAMKTVTGKAWSSGGGSHITLGEEKSDKPVLNDFLIRKVVPRERDQHATGDVCVQEKHLQQAEGMTCSWRCLCLPLIQAAIGTNALTHMQKEGEWRDLPAQWGSDCCQVLSSEPWRCRTGSGLRQDLYWLTAKGNEGMTQRRLGVHLQKGSISHVFSCSLSFIIISNIASFGIHHSFNSELLWQLMCTQVIQERCPLRDKSILWESSRPSFGSPRGPAKLQGVFSGFITKCQVRLETFPQFQWCSMPTDQCWEQFVLSYISTQNSFRGICSLVFCCVGEHAELSILLHKMQEQRNKLSWKYWLQGY